METATQLRGRLDGIRAAGADLVFIGNGSVKFAARFQERHVPDCPVYTDPALRTYRVLGMKRGIAATLGPSSLLKGIRSALRGHVQTSTQGDAWQQGGLYAVAKGGEIVFEQVNGSAGDRPDIDGALAALRGQGLATVRGRPGRRSRAAF